MPPRLTLREIHARRQRAEEGVARFKSLSMEMTAEMNARMPGGGIWMVEAARAMADVSLNWRLEEIRVEMEMIREGMLKTSIEVNE